jgi:hypothetical protein
MPQIKFRKFVAIVKTWDTVFQEAAQFATTIGPDRVVSISHSADGSKAIVTVWYWEK